MSPSGLGRNVHRALTIGIVCLESFYTSIKAGLENRVRSMRCDKVCIKKMNDVECRLMIKSFISVNIKLINISCKKLT